MGNYPGVAGAVYTGFSLQVDNTPFRPNIDSVRIKRQLSSPATTMISKGLITKYTTGNKLVLDFW